MKTVIVYDRQGNEVESRGIERTAALMGIGVTKLRKRLKDGRVINRDGYVSVRVRLA